MKKSIAWIAVLVIAMAAGCTKSGSVSGPKEGTFRIAIGAKIPSLDPSKTSDLYSSQAMALFMEPLLQFHPFKRPYELEPLLAESLPKISLDGKTMTFKLKQGVLFRDDPCFKDTAGKGREVVAQDVVNMIERLADKKINSPFYGSFAGNVVGIDAFHDGKAPNISGLKVLDKYTIEIKLAKSMPRFIYNFSDVKSAIMPKECIAFYGDQIDRNPVGTGAFIPKQVDLGNKIVAVKNPNYKHMTYPSEGSAGDKEAGLLDDAGKQLPVVDQVIYEIITETQPAWLKFKAGELEISGVPKDSYSTALPGGKLAKDLADRGVVHTKQPRGDITVMIFNMNDPVWGKKKELRQAFALALDVPRFIEIQYSGQAIRAHSVADPTMYGYEENFVSKWANRDLDKAKALLAKAGYPEGKGLPPLNFPTQADTTARQFDELLTKQLKEVGITLQSEPMTWPEFSKRMHDHRFGIVGLGYSSSFPDFDDASGLLHSKNIENGYNSASYKNAEMDQLISDIEAMPDGAARMKKIRRFKEIMDEDLPIVMMTHRIANELRQPWVRNHKIGEGNMLGTNMKYRKVVATEKK